MDKMVWNIEEGESIMTNNLYVNIVYLSTSMPSLTTLLSSMYFFFPYLKINSTNLLTTKELNFGENLIFPKYEDIVGTYW